MGKRLTILITFVSILLVFVILGYFAFQSIQANLDQLLTAEVQDIDVSTVEDGSYLGEYSQFPISVEVFVVISDGAFESITILKHDTGQGTPAEAITASVIAEQSLMVDAIAGASYSSKCILLAILDALTSGTDDE